MAGSGGVSDPRSGNFDIVLDPDLEKRRDLGHPAPAFPIKNGDYRQASSFLSAATLTAINTPQKQAEFMKRSEQLRPMQYRAASLTLSNDGQSADLQLSGRCDYSDGKTRSLTTSEEANLQRNPPLTQGCYLPLRFVKDTGGWKLDGPLEQTGEGRCRVPQGLASFRDLGPVLCQSCRTRV